MTTKRQQTPPRFIDFCRDHYGTTKTAAELRIGYNMMLANFELEGADQSKKNGVTSLEQFRAIIGECSSTQADAEANRLKRRHTKYKDTIRRHVLIALLTGEYSDWKTFRDAARAARMKDPPTKKSRTEKSAGGYGHAADRHVVRLAMRVLYYRRVCRELPDGLETDLPPVPDAVAREDVGKILSKHGIELEKSSLSAYCPNTGRRQRRRRAQIDTVPA